jgi:SAM-dependent methyltransferase
MTLPTLTELPGDVPVTRPCPVCEEAAPSTSLGEKNGFDWRRCGRCGTAYVDRLPSAAELDRMYGLYYGPQNLQLPPFLKDRLREMVRKFAPYRQEGHLLDVGFGAGLLLETAEEAGWQCWGTEISPPALVKARARGWRVLEGDLCRIQLPGDLFDVICLIEVLEHLPDPMEYIRQAFHLLRPGGIMYATTPNGSGLNARALGPEWSIFSPPEHLQLFSAASLAQAARRAGFSSVSVRAEGLNPAELRRSRQPADAPPVDRVQTAYALNEAMSSRPHLRLAKSGVNNILSTLRLGDTVKILARKAPG